MSKNGYSRRYDFYWKEWTPPEANFMDRTKSWYTLGEVRSEPISSKLSLTKSKLTNHNILHAPPVAMQFYGGAIKIIVGRGKNNIVSVNTSCEDRHIHCKSSCAWLV